MSKPPRSCVMLASEDCAPIAKVVHDAERFWTPRHRVAKAFTLGASCYLDVPSFGIEEYYRRAVRGNALLLRRFRPLYDKLKTTLKGELGAPVAYTNRFALPGFHVFVGSPETRSVEPSIHFDLQDMDLDWEDGALRPEDGRISFTLPVEMPKGGAGLYVWDVEIADHPCPTDDELVELAKREKHYFPYELGRLAIHSGDRLHQIAGDRETMDGEARMTLQGHGRLTKGTWILYW